MLLKGFKIAAWHVLRVRILAMGLNHVPRVPWELISRRRVKSLASLVRVFFLLTGLEQAPQRTVKWLTLAFQVRVLMVVLV